MKKRDDFLRAMSSFRPKETIFEAFATGKEKGAGVVSQVDRGRTDLLGKKSDSKAAALGAMKSMRRQMKMARDKGNTLVVAGSHSAMTRNGEEVIEDDDEDGMEDVANPIITTERSTIDTAPETKRRLSKAERKRLKKNPKATAEAAAKAATAKTKKSKAKDKRGTDFRDTENYMENDIALNSDAVERSRQIEAAMQPSSSGDTKGLAASALKLEQSMLDIVGDEREDLVKRQRMMRWDKSKRKYVQTTVGDALSGESRSKKVRVESGQLVQSKKIKLGELYEKWQKKTNKSVGRVGVFDDVTEDDGATPGVSFAKGGSDVKYGDDTNSKKSSAQIRKERAGKQNMKLKNMKKQDRRRLENRARTDRKNMQEVQMSKAAMKAANMGKKGLNGRWAGNVKKMKR
mmetsp:Transcript_23801/g.49176  ORF Transcript_23801/g.49176 Transcript_23801/m.49176 type:complete len:403 (-) Transcript_23801:24-1232(-)